MKGFLRAACKCIGTNLPLRKNCVIDRRTWPSRLLPVVMGFPAVNKIALPESERHGQLRLPKHAMSRCHMFFCGVSVYPTHHAKIFFFKKKRRNSTSSSKPVPMVTRQANFVDVSALEPAVQNEGAPRCGLETSFEQTTIADFHCQSDHVPCHLDAEVLDVQKVPAGLFFLPRFFWRSRHVWLPTAHL